MKYKKRNTGFTLIELSIVLVIISLIVGGVIGGKALIRSSEALKLVQQLQSYQTALKIFQLQYDALPGDMIDAQDFWPNDCLDHNGDLCNGDGNNRIEVKSNGSNMEHFRFWQHLGLAEILPEKYTGYYVWSKTCDGGLPCNKILSEKRVCIAPGYVINEYYKLFGNHLKLGAGYSFLCHSIAYTPQNAKMLDLKFDDGLANKGRIRSWGSYPYSCATVRLGNVYKLTNTDVACIMGYMLD